MRRDRIAAEALRTSHGATHSLVDVSLAVPPGQILGLVGAGKTSLLQLLSGLVPPGAGRVCLNGHDLARERENALASVSALVQVELGQSDSQVGLRWECLVDGQPISDLGPVPHTARRRTALTRVLSSRATILLLDEPLMGFDQQTVATMGDRLRRLAHRGVAIVLATGDPFRAYALCDRIAVLESGCLALDLPAPRALGLSTPAAYRIEVEGALDDHWAAWFDGLTVASGAERTVISGRLADQSALHSVLARVRDLGLPLVSVEWLPPTLAEVLARLSS